MGALKASESSYVRAFMHQTKNDLLLWRSHTSIPFSSNMGALIKHESYANEIFFKSLFLKFVRKLG